MNDIVAMHIGGFVWWILRGFKNSYLAEIGRSSTEQPMDIHRQRTRNVRTGYLVVVLALAVYYAIHRLFVV